MTDDLRALWKKNYPSWPDGLIDKFQKFIQIDLYLYDNDLSVEWKSEYDYQTSPKAIGENYTAFATNYHDTNRAYDLNFGRFQFLNPTNADYVESINLDLYNYNLDAYFDSVDFPNFRIYSIHVAGAVYDKRLFTNVNRLNVIIYKNKIITDSEKLQLLQNAGIYVPNASLLKGDVNNIDFVYYPNYTVANYQGCKSILLLHENGIDYDFNYDDMNQYMSYKNAYEKFRDQIESAGALSLQQAQNDLQNYQQSLADKLQAEKNNLQNLQLQIQTAMQNQITNTKQNLTNTMLQAASLKLQITGALS